MLNVPLIEDRIKGLCWVIISRRLVVLVTMPLPPLLLTLYANCPSNTLKRANYQTTNSKMTFCGLSRQSWSAPPPWPTRFDLHVSFALDDWRSFRIWFCAVWRNWSIRIRLTSDPAGRMSLECLELRRVRTGNPLSRSVTLHFFGKKADPAFFWKFFFRTKFFTVTCVYSWPLRALRRLPLRRSCRTGRCSHHTSKIASNVSPSSRATRSFRTLRWRQFDSSAWWPTTLAPIRTPSRP